MVDVSPPKTLTTSWDALAVVTTAALELPEYWRADMPPPPPPPPPPQAANSNRTTSADNSRANFNLQVDMIPLPKGSSLDSGPLSPYLDSWRGKAMPNDYSPPGKFA